MRLLLLLLLLVLLPWPRKARLERGGDEGREEVGDSGEDPGDESVTEDESTVEMVVVGDESVESVEAKVEMLCWA